MIATQALDFHEVQITEFGVQIGKAPSTVERASSVYMQPGDGKFPTNRSELKPTQKKKINEWEHKNSEWQSEIPSVFHKQATEFD